MMADFYMVLGLQDGSSIEDIKKAYRKKAREYHPDLNHSGGAMDKFIEATEAYEFLLAHANSNYVDQGAFNSTMEEWNLYRRDVARHRAQKYARASYVQFKNTKFYKTTRILDGTTIIFSLIIAIGVIIFAIYGYIWRLNNMVRGEEKPSVVSFILLLSVGLIFLGISLIFLRAYYQSSKEYKAKHKSDN